MTFDFNQPQSRHSTLTGSQVLDIRRLRAEGLSDTDLAEQFNVSRKAIYNIVERHTWNQVPKPKTVRGFKDYTVYPDGRVFSKATGEQINTINRASGPAVRLRTSGGARTTIGVCDLVKKGFGRIAA